MTPQRLTPRIHCQSARLLPQTVVPPPTPALLKSKCTAPQVSYAFCASASTSSAFETSVCTASTSAPLARISSPACLRAPASTSASTTFMPSCALFSASARPMPLAAPVTTATFPWKSSIFLPFFCIAKRLQLTHVSVLYLQKRRRIQHWLLSCYFPIIGPIP